MAQKREGKPLRPRQFSIPARKPDTGKFFTRGFWLWLGILAAPAVACGLVGLVALWIFSWSLPPLENLERIEPQVISKVFDHDSVLIHEFYTERRLWSEYEDIPELLRQAIIAIEDRRFFDHWGVNLMAYPPALLPMLWGGRPRGASTLTQQLAKNLFLTSERSVSRKLKEVMLAVSIERTYTKEEIFEFYANQVYLGSGAYGFRAAAQKYWSASLDSLSVAQYAILAGLLQRPESYRPDDHPERARERRDLVLRAMREEGFISKTQLVEALAEPVEVNVWNPDAFVAPYFVETVRQFIEKKWDESYIYGRGIQIHTTLDYGIQSAADSAFQAGLEAVRRRLRARTARSFAIARHLGVDKKTLYDNWDSLYAVFDSTFLAKDRARIAENPNARRRFPDSLEYVEAQGALVVIENETGAIRAMIGGQSFETSKFNRAVQALRSPGSSFKPFVYTAAIDNGASPMDTVNDQPITIPDPVDSNVVWSPKNYDGEFKGNISMRQALYLSRNLPAIKTAIRYGLGTVVSYARRFGLSHNLPAVPAIGIGTCEATLLEMASAYSVFPNQGIRPEPFYVERIDDRVGRTFHRHIPRHHETIRPQTAYIITTMLQDVNVRGTAASIWAQGFHHPSGGKTGTTNGETDAWYIGFTKYYTTGVWVGADDHRPMGRGHTGTHDAVPIWLDLMHAVHRDLEPLDFPVPRGVVYAKVCHLPEGEDCERCRDISEDYFVAGTEPEEMCDDIHIVRIRSTRQYTGDVFSSRKRRYSTPPAGTSKKSGRKKGDKEQTPRTPKTF